MKRGVCTLEENLTTASRFKLRHEVISMLDNEVGLVLVRLDFRNVRYIDSAGCGTLVTISKLCRQRLVALEICCVDDEIRQLMSLTRLDTLFTICDPCMPDGEQRDVIELSGDMDYKKMDTRTSFRLEPDDR